MEKVGEITLEVMKKASWYNNWLFSWVERHLGKRVLEIGSGIGNFTPLLLKDDRRVVATDIEKEYLEGLKKNLKNNRLSIHGLDIENESGDNLGKFDTIVCMNVLEHIKDDKKALGNMNRLLKTGGKLILLVPAHPVFFGEMDRELGHFRRYTKSQLQKILSSSGFRVNKTRYLNWLGGLGWFFNSRFLGRKILPSNQLSIFDKIARPFLKVEEFVEPPFGLSILAIVEKR